MEHAIRSILNAHKYTVVNFRIPLIKYLETLVISIVILSQNLKQSRYKKIIYSNKYLLVKKKKKEKKKNEIRRRKEKLSKIGNSIHETYSCSYLCPFNQLDDILQSIPKEIN